MSGPAPGLYLERRTPLDLSVPCKIWEGFRNTETGYGIVMVDSQLKLVHRLTYQLHVGPIARTWQIDHVCHGAALAAGECAPGPCNHRACYEPAHLESVSSRENTLRGGHPLVAIRLSLECKRGHSMTNPENVYTYPNGKRKCRTCTNASRREWERSKKAGRAKVRV
jgi:hypothetical protein